MDTIHYCARTDLFNSNNEKKIKKQNKKLSRTNQQYSCNFDKKYAAINFYSIDGTLWNESLNFPNVLLSCLNSGSVRSAMKALFFSYFSSLLIKALCPSCPSRNIIESGEKGKCCFNLICRRTMGQGLC